jgi:hypothetical protein
MIHITKPPKNKGENNKYYMRYIIGPDGEILEVRNTCPISCSSVTGTGSGSVCRCCENIEFNKCSYFTGGMDCPVPDVPPPVVAPIVCTTRIITRGSGSYMVSSNGSVQRVCN